MDETTFSEISSYAFFEVYINTVLSRFRLRREGVVPASSHFLFLFRYGWSLWIIFGVRNIYAHLSFLLC